MAHTKFIDLAFVSGKAVTSESARSIMATLEESALLVDRALVTLCQELPESLGLYNTGKDQLSLAAMRGVPLLERLEFESRKHFILKDWMRSYVWGEDQAVTTEVSIDSLRETLRKERKERQRLEQQRQDATNSSEGLSAEERKRQRKKERHAKETSAKKANSTSSSSKKVKAKSKVKAAKAKPKRKARRDSDSDTEFVVGDDEVSMESSDSESSTSSSSESDSASSDEETKESGRSSRKKSGDSKKKKKVKSNLPAMEDVVSSDEDEEPNEMFDTEDPDVYEVESVLDKRTGRGGDPEYLIKWVGYEETTWEPASNVSKDLVDEFEGQPVRENEYAVEEIRDRRAKRDPETRLKTHEYRVKWVGYDDETWEPADNLPRNLRRKFDQKYEARKRRRR